MKKCLAFLLIFCSFSALWAQSKVSGKIIDESDNKPIPFATAAIFRMSDSSLVDGAIANLNGFFEIQKIPKGKYMLKVSFVGYTTMNKEIEVPANNAPLSLQSLKLRPGVELDAFEVKETYVPITMKEDTVEYSAEAFRAVEGSALEELLKKLPGVEVDKDGKITAKGQEITKILVDGKKFFSDDPKVASKNIPAELIDKIQFYDKKSDQAEFTGIDDGEAENVINLTIKPGMKKGWFGRITAGGGMDIPGSTARYDNNVNLNYFRDNDQLTILGGFNNVNGSGFTDIMGTNVVIMGGRGGTFSFPASGGNTQSLTTGLNFVKNFSPKLVAGGSYSFSRSDNNSEMQTHRENILPNGSTFYNEKKKGNSLNYQHRFDAEVTYKMDSANEFIFRPNLSYASKRTDLMGDYQTLDENGQMINQGVINNNEFSSALNANLSVIYRHRFAKPRRSLSVTLDGGFRVNDGNAINYSENNFASRQGDTVNQNVINNSLRTNWSARLVYTEPLKNDFNLEFRYTLSQSIENTEKVANAFDYLTNDYILFDTTYSNNYGNTFLNQNAEVRLQKRHGKSQYSVGLGLFPSLSESYIEGAEIVPQNVVNWAPSFHYSYTWSKQRSLRIRYNGRTSQPSITQLQPVPDNSDPLNVRIGNADLKPEFSHRIGMFYNYFMPTTMSSIFAMLHASMTQNKIATISIYSPELFPEISLPDSLRPGARVSMAQNVGTTYNANGVFTYSTPIFTSKLTLSTTTNLSVANSRSIIDKDENILNNLGGAENLRITYRLNNFDVSASGRININSAMYSLQTERNNVYYTYSCGGDFNWTIFKNFILSSDISFKKTTGYSDGYNPQYTNWNAQVSWTFGKAKQATLRFRMVDILNKNNNTIRNTSDTYIEDVIYNTIGRYGMLSLTYNLNPTKQRDMPRQEGRGPHGHGGGPGMVIIRN